MWAAIASKAGEKITELAIGGLVAAVGWGIWTTGNVSALQSRQTEDHSAVTAATGHLNEVIAEQRVTNARLDSIRELLQLMREERKQQSR